MESNSDPDDILELPIGESARYLLRRTVDPVTQAKSRVVMQANDPDWQSYYGSNEYDDDISPFEWRVRQQQRRNLQQQSVDVTSEPNRVGDAVNHPSHYTQGGVECIDAMEAAMSPEEFRGYCRGAAFKYLWRCTSKGRELEDLKKSKWYLERLIQLAEKEGEK